MWLNDFSMMSFEPHFNCFWRNILTFQYYGLFVEFPWFPGFRFWVQGSKRKPKITDNLYFWVYKVQMNVDLFFGHYFNFLSTKTKIYKYKFNFINLDRLEALKRQALGSWLGILLNHIDIYVFWRISQVFEAAFSYFSIMAFL